MNKETAKLFIEKYIAGNYTKSEHTEFVQWFDTLPDTEKERLIDQVAEHIPGDNQRFPATENEFRKIEVLIHAEGKQLNPAKGKLAPLFRFRNIAVAVAAASILFAVVWLWPERKSTIPDLVKEVAKEISPLQDLSPGSDKATLTLANGSTIILDSTSIGSIAQQGGITINKADSGLLSYKAVAHHQPASEIIYNTLSTPNGGQYRLVLDDGTKVWLNAASSLRFPALFSGSERRVFLTGEAYFEVTHNAKRPFIVSVGNTEIQDLGTEFNINAYKDEPSMNITLVNGLAAVKTKDESVTLQPGKAAVIRGSNTEVVNADITIATAWKQGVFQFNETDMKTVMRQLARWYNIQDVEYKGSVNQRFNGSIYRNSKASEVFKMFEENGKVKFTIDGNKIVVAPAE